nr:2-hydroxychromene-2-carboxylate isomerase [Polymorphobacter sp.]
MTRTIEFLFDVGSPTTYLAHKRLAGVAQRSGARVDYVPVLLGGIFKATGNASPAMVPAKGIHMFTDMGRYADRHGIMLRNNPHFPINTLTMMRMLAGMKGKPGFAKLVDTLFNAMWETPRNMGDPAELAAVLTAAGLDADAMLAAASDPDAKAALVAATESAVARGAFGAPTFFVDGAMYFGQDRLDWVEEAAAA